jgi:hypothetical protein
MRFRPANIRLINRRSKLPRLLLALPSEIGKSNNKDNPIDTQGLTGSLHIRAFSEFGNSVNFIAASWAVAPDGRASFRPWIRSTSFPKML